MSEKAKVVVLGGMKTIDEKGEEWVVYTDPDDERATQWLVLIDHGEDRPYEFPHVFTYMSRWEAEDEARIERMHRLGYGDHPLDEESLWDLEAQGTA